ncbi:MAG: hypothetical protein ACTS27_01040 [Phycisphaerales bacterium]
MNLVQKLRQTADDLRAGPNGPKAQDAWALAARLLTRVPVDQARAADVCAARDVDGLDAMVARLESPETPPTPGTSVPDADLDRALRAFKKRLKVMRLADESKLGGRQLSQGRRSEIDAIVPPTEFPREIWLALAARGDLKDTGGGFFSLTSESP